MRRIASPCPFMNPARPRAGFTLIELIAVIGILAVLIVLFAGVVGRLPGVGDRAKSTSNLRALHLALDQYMDDHNQQWPQQPMFSAAQQKQYEDWWLDALKPYDIKPVTWQCPAILRLGKIQQNGISPRIHYSPTMFDGRPNTAFRWPNMPWLVQIANVFGHGPLLILPDGSVHDWDTYLAQHQKR